MGIIHVGTFTIDLSKLQTPEPRKPRSRPRVPKQYTAHGFAGCVEQRARYNGAIVGVYEAEQAGLCTEGGKWVIVCEDHGQLENHGSLTRAQQAARKPDGFCTECRRALGILDED